MVWQYSNQWAAGFFDGEGNIYLRLRPKRKTRDVYAQVTQKDPMPLRYLHHEWGGSLTETKTPSSCYRWRVSGQKAERFLFAIAPYVLVKDEKVKEALAERMKVRRYHANRGKK